MATASTLAIAHRLLAGPVVADAALVAHASEDPDAGAAVRGAATPPHTDDAHDATAVGGATAAANRAAVDAGPVGGAVSLDGGQPPATPVASEPPPRGAGGAAMAATGHAPAIRATAERGDPPRLPMFGVGADVGLPDGANASLVVRPVSWARLQLALGSNGIGLGYRVGGALLPMRDGPALVAEYGHYQDGDANAMAARLGVSDAHVRPLLERVGYDYVNLHLALNFGYQRVVFFVQGGLSVVRGHIHNVAPFVHQQTDTTAAGSTSTEVVVQQDPSVRATGVAGKLGLVFYVW